MYFSDTDLCVYLEGREGQREGDNPWVYLLQTSISKFLLAQSIEAALLGRRLQLGESTLYPQGRKFRPPSLGCTRDSGPSQKKPDSTRLRDPKTITGSL